MALPKTTTRAPAVLLQSVLDDPIRFKVVDVGANPEDGQPPPYSLLLKAGDIDIVGFEPNLVCLEVLNARKQSNETYLPYAIGDGRRHTFHWCLANGMSSLLEPNEDLLKLFHVFTDFGRVVQTTDVDTVRLDDIPETAGTEFIKMDVQGGELIVLNGATERLKDVVAVQTEVLFMQMYKNQPLFDDIHAFMRQQGFVLHKFVDLADCTLSPFTIDQNPLLGGGSQVVWSDAVFVRDLTRLDLLTDRQLLVLATIAHGFYGSFDLATLLLRTYDVRRSRDFAKRYLSALEPYFGERKLALKHFTAADFLAAKNAPRSSSSR